MREPQPMPALLDRAKALVDAITFDDSGALIAGHWQGGNGGLISRDTIKVADELRREIARAESAGQGGRA